MKNIQIKIILFILAVFALSNTLIGQSFRHTAAGGNISGHITYLDHALTNNLPNKLLFVSQEWGSAGPYNPHTVGVWYSNNKWTVFNQDFAAMPQQAKFNVLALDPGERVFIHTASSATISRHVTTIDHPLLNNNPNARMLVTQNWGNAGPYNKNAVGVYYTGSRWAIYNQNRAAMPVNAKFNVWVDDRIFVVAAATPTTNWFVFDNPATNNQPNALVFATQYWTNVYNTHEIGTWYTNNKWSIFNQDRATMPANAKFFVYVPGAVTTVPTARVMTRFNPAVHGFKFVNNFSVQTRLAGFNGPTFGGLCGGMVYAALDYYYAGSLIPQQNYMPAEGMPLQSYLYNRQMNSALPNADKWIEYGVNPFGSRNREFFNWGLQLGSGRLGELISKIDRGDPVPLGLQACGNDCGCPGGCPGSHQVLAIGYDMGRYKGDVGENIEDLSIFVYDPNYPGRTLTLQPKVGGAMYVYNEEGQNEVRSCRWRAYFTDMKYTRSTPPAVSTAPNEVVAVFRTGGDDLRGGNDNVHLVLLMRSGATIRFENVNNGKRWADGSIQPISRPLAANFNAADIVGVRLETTLGGGIGGDNWNLEALKIEIRVNGANNIVFDKAATPLFRFTGNQRTREFRF